MKKNILFIAVVLFVVVLLYTLSTKNVVPIPSDEKHIDIKSEKACSECHPPDRVNAQGKKHPPKFECFKCHKIQKQQ